MSRIRGLLVGTTICLASTGAALALDDSKQPAGANHAKAHAAPHNATGAGINVGVIEGGLKLNATHNLGTRLKSQYDFHGGTPGTNPADGTLSATSSNHLTLVSDVVAGSGVVFPGVATGANIYTAGINGVGNPATNAERDGDDAIHNGAFNAYRAAVSFLHNPVGGPQPAGSEYLIHPRISLFNNSWGAIIEQNDNGDNRFARFVDHFATTRDALFVGAAGNDADVAGEKINWPWDAYNGITVGALDRQPGGAYHTRVNWSQYWLSPDDGTAADDRGKPDIVAPGVDIGDGTLSESGTSFATPHVTGTAALLMEKGLDLPGPSGRNHQALKAIILNSARKRHLNAPENGFGQAFDHSTTDSQASDGDYLNPDGSLRGPGDYTTSPKTNQWTPSLWSYDGTTFRAHRPLDDELGVGALDTTRALIQQAGGEHAPGLVPLIGWDRSATFTGDTADHSYLLDDFLFAGNFLTTTLAWDRVVAEVNAGGGTIGVVDTGDTYSITGLTDLNLQVYFQDSVLVAESISITDNVEHLHIPLPFDGEPGDYSIRVLLNGASVGDLTDFAVAWWTAVPEPSSVVALAMGAALVLVRRRGPMERARCAA